MHKLLMQPEHNDKHRTNADFLSRSRWWKDDCSSLAGQVPGSTQITADSLSIQTKHVSHLIVPQPWELARKVQLSLIGSRQCTFHQAINESSALPLSPQRVAQNENFYIWRCLWLLSCRYRRHFKFGMWVKHSKSQPTDDKTSRNGRGYVT